MPLIHGKETVISAKAYVPSANALAFLSQEGHGMRMAKIINIKIGNNRI
jgi:hypothetical protein